MKTTHLLILAMVLIKPVFAREDILYSRNRDWKIPGSYPSPDGRYSLRVTDGDGEVVSLRITGTDGKSLINRFNFIQGFTWLPNKRHSLLFALATDNDGGPSGLFIWSGAAKIRTLLKPKNANQNLALVGVDRRGWIIYEYWPNLNTTNRKEFGPFIKKMRLP